MKKATLLKHLMYGYFSELNTQDYEDLKSDLMQHDKSINATGANQLAESILKNYPQFQIMQDAYVRKRMDKIATNVATIKVIILICFISSIVAALIIASNIK